MFRSLVYSLFCFALLCCCDKAAYGLILPEIKSVRIGIENTYKNGLWTPITVELDDRMPSGFGGQLLIRCSDSDGTPITYHYNIGEEEKQITVLAKLGRKDEPLQISLYGNPFISHPVPPPVNAERPIYLIIGNDDIGLQGAVAELMLREDRRPLLVKVNSFADLPDRWFGYEAVEMVVLTTTEPQLFDGLTAESPQMKALDDWVKLGGKMLLCAGKDAGQFLEPSDGFLRLFLPGEFDKMTEQRTGAKFESFVNSKRQIFMNGTDEAPFMKMPLFTNPRGITFLSDGDVNKGGLPLVLRSAHGLGTIIYFGGDLSEKPLALWRDRPLLVRSIMQWDTVKRAAVDPRAGAMLQLGYNDITGQIRSALDQFEGVRIVPFSIILIILTAYWLVVGLFDWFFVHKILKRPILTWVTFPLWIVLFSVLTYVLAAPGRPAMSKSNGLVVWDVDSDTGISRVSTWDNVYSSTDGRHNVDASSNDSSYYSWNGLPGSGLGGMAPKTVSPPVWQVSAEQRSYNSIVLVPVQIRSTKSYFGQHVLQNLDKHEMLAAKLSDEEGVPIGTIEMPHNFDATLMNPTTSLKNGILVYGRWAIELGDIQPGQTLNIAKTTPRRELRELLLPPKARENENLRGMATYNPQSTDLEYIVRVMSLYRMLGGHESTGLHHAYMPSLDMSELLTADRVLLLGTVKRKYAPGELEDILALSEPGCCNSTSTIRAKDRFTTTEIFRQSFPITLTELSPRLNIDRYGQDADDPLRERRGGTGLIDPGSGR